MKLFMECTIGNHYLIGREVESIMDVGIIVDIETTGLDPNKDKIIEIGICEFGWEEGAEPILLSMYGGLEDPGIPLDPYISKLTGLTDHSLKNQKIDWQLVQNFWQRANIVIE